MGSGEVFSIPLEEDAYSNRENEEIPVSKNTFWFQSIVLPCTRHLSFKCNFVKLSSCHGQLKRSVRVTALTADLPLD